jgi:hypothetical protein
MDKCLILTATKPTCEHHQVEANRRGCLALTLQHNLSAKSPDLVFEIFSLIAVRYPSNLITAGSQSLDSNLTITYLASASSQQGTGDPRRFNGWRPPQQQLSGVSAASRQSESMLTVPVSFTPYLCTGPSDIFKLPIRLP